MKTILKLLFLSGIIVITAFSCEKGKEEQYENISLIYSKCPCDHETDFIKSFSAENILLFDSIKTSFSEMKELSLDGECSKFISYSPESDSTVFYSICNHMVGVGYPCNFPQIVEKWEISPEGTYISFSADEFELCNPENSITTYTYSNLVLTSLKKLKK